jgi:actin-related protein 5
MAIALIPTPVTSELMFELYSVPSLAYCVDAVMAFYQNHLPADNQSWTTDGIVLSFNHASTSVIPMLEGKSLMNLAKRSVMIGCVSDYV